MCRDLFSFFVCWLVCWLFPCFPTIQPTNQPTIIMNLWLRLNSCAPVGAQAQAESYRSEPKVGGPKEKVK